MIWFRSRSNLAKLQRINLSLQVGTSNIQPSSVVRNLGVYMDSELMMKEHDAKIAAACFYHIRRLRQVRRRVGQEVTQQLVLALIMSRLAGWTTVTACWRDYQRPRCSHYSASRMQLPDWCSA